MSTFRIGCWHYRFSWLGSLQIVFFFFLSFFSRRSPTWERRFHFVSWWEFRKVLAVLPLGRWTHRVNWVKYLRRVDLCVFTSRHGTTSQKTWNLRQHHCENRKFHISFGVIKTRVRFDMHGNDYVRTVSYLLMGRLSLDSWNAFVVGECSDFRRGVFEVCAVVERCVA